MQTSQAGEAPVEVLGQEFYNRLFTVLDTQILNQDKSKQVLLAIYRDCYYTNLP